MSGVLTSASFETLANLLKTRSGLVIGPDKIYLLETRLAGIMKREALADLNALAEKLRKPGSDTIARDLVEAMTTNESFFFRDDKPFDHFKNHALPRILASRPPGSTVRIWSAASSSGQEAYSLAMILLEQRHATAACKFEIVGTDIAREQLQRARSGVYTQFEVQRGLPVQLLMKHFKKDGSNWRINEPLRNMVQFKEFNLLGDLRPLGRFDVVFCRNVLIYFDQPTKTKVLDAAAAIMPPDGVLYLGGAETVLGITNRFAPLPGERGVYGLAGATAKTPAPAAVTAPPHGTTAVSPSGATGVVPATVRARLSA